MDIISEGKAPSSDQVATTPAQIRVREYQKEYHKEYSPIYYSKNRDKIRSNQKQYWGDNRLRLNSEKNAKNAAILASKKFYCVACQRSCVSASALKKHSLGKRHRMSEE